MGLTQIEYDFMTKTPRLLTQLVEELQDLKKEVKELKAQLKAKEEGK